MSKIVVKYHPWGRMGNRMFSYAFGRILAEERKGDLYVEPINEFPNTFDHKRPNEAGTLNNPIVTNNYGDQFADVHELMNTDRDVIVNSFLQHAEYYIDFKEKINQWFNIDIKGFKLPDDDELVVNIRETDYIQIGKYLNEDYYINQIREQGIRKTTIVTDNCESTFVKRLEQAGCKVLSTEPVPFKINNDNNIMQDYIYMYFAKYLILSQSTFSWWPAFLGEHTSVIYPVSDGGMWPKNPNKNDVDLFVEGFKRVII